MLEKLELELTTKYVSIHSQRLNWEMLLGVGLGYLFVFVSIHSQRLNWEMLFQIPKW